MTIAFWLAIALVVLFGSAAFIGAPYVPSKRREVEVALSDLYPLGPSDTLVDIGSGDGLVLRVAASRGAKCVGYEINPLLVVISRILSRKDSEVTIHLANFWTASLPVDTTVVYTFGDSRDIKRMADKVATTARNIGRPLMFISYAIEVPGMKPIKVVGPHFLYEIEPLQSRPA